MRSLDDIFLEAREITDPLERERFLAGACGPDKGLRARLEAMLGDEQAAADFFGSEADPDEAVVDYLAEKLGTVIGRYKLLEKIGEGGMGVVYMAEQREPVVRKVALKIIKLGMDTRQVVARFEAERQALALMDHPHIAKVLDGGATNAGRPYFVMELVEGIPITEFCERNHVSIDERLKLFVPVCHAIQSAHQKGIIHRDVKPSNVLVTIHNGAPHPMVIDFGVAKAIDQKLTEKTLFTNFATMIGTPAYMSPEQAEMSKLDVDTRSDIYSLGVLLYELLTGTTPFPEERLRSVGYGEMQRIIAEENPERPSTLVKTKVATTSGDQLAKAQIASDLDWIVMKCLEKDRNRRYQTANGLAADIARYLANEPVVASPPSRFYEFQKAVRRHKIGFAATGAVITALTVGSVVSTWYAVQAERARRAAVSERERADEQAVIAQAVNSFLQQDIIGQADSWSQIGGGFAADPNLSVRLALDRAAQRIGERFKMQPLVEAEIRNTIGKAYNALGQFEQAVPQLEKACALQGSRVGPAHPELLAFQSALAEAYTSTGRTKEAARILESVMTQQQKSLGLSHSDTLQSAGRLVYAYKQVSLADKEFASKAISLGEQTLTRCKAKYGSYHPATVKIFNWLADAYLTASRADDALRLVEPALPQVREKLGPSHPEVLIGTHMLARSYMYLGQAGKAVALFEQNLASAIATIGTNHSYIIDAMIGLADAYAANREPEKALRVYGETLDKAKTISPGLVEACLIQSARLYLEARQLDKAIPLVEELLTTKPRQLRPREPWVLEALSRLVQACYDAGYGYKAAPFLEEIVAWQKQHLPVNDPRLQSNLKRLAIAYPDAGNSGKTLPLLQPSDPSQNSRTDR